MELARETCCRDLKKYDVLDSTGEKVGKIDDFTFTFDSGELKLSQFVLAGPKWEEFLETIKVKPDRDPVFNSTLITKVDENIHLNTSSNSLKTTLDESAISEREIRFSQLEKLRIFDKDGVNVGKAVDVDFDVDGSVSLIVGGSFFEEKLEAAGLTPDIDIIVPTEVITEIGESIKLMQSKSDLSRTMEDALEEQAPSLKKAISERDAHRQEARDHIRLHSPRL
jgi:sporulation protein YlmC with PRC-barrel domain